MVPTLCLPLGAALAGRTVRAQLDAYSKECAAGLRLGRAGFRLPFVFTSLLYARFMDVVFWPWFDRVPSGRFELMRVGTERLTGRFPVSLTIRPVRG